MALARELDVSNALVMKSYRFSARSYNTSFPVLVGDFGSVDAACLRAGEDM